MKISKNCYDYNSQRIITSPKTKTSTRIIPLPKRILKIIKELNKETNSDFIINEKDKPLKVRSY